MKGKRPASLAVVDDAVLCIQINTASVRDDTGDIRSHLRAAFADGHLDERDVPNLLEAARLANRAHLTCIETDDFCDQARGAVRKALETREPLRKAALTRQATA